MKDSLFKFLKNHRSEHPKEKPKADTKKDRCKKLTPKVIRKKRVELPQDIMDKMIKMRSDGSSYWDLTVYLYRQHSIDLALATVTKKIKKAISKIP